MQIYIPETVLLIGEVYPPDGIVQLASTCPLQRHDLDLFYQHDIYHLVVPESSRRHMELILAGQLTVAYPALRITYVNRIDDLVPRLFLGLLQHELEYENLD